MHERFVESVTYGPFVIKVPGVSYIIIATILAKIRLVHGFYNTIMISLFIYFFTNLLMKKIKEKT